MPNLNKVQLMGNLTRDPELRQTKAGTSVCEIGLAINRKWTNDAGEAQEETTFVDVTIWGKRGETIAKYCRKGQPLYLEGRLHLDTWEDKETGQARSKLKVIGESFQFLGSAKRKKEGETGREGEGETPEQAGPLEGDDDIPF